MTRHLIIAMIAVLSFYPRGALAVDGHELLQKCKDTNAASLAFCLGYITAISDMLESRIGDGPSLICNTTGAGADTLRRVVLKYLRTHPLGQTNANSVVDQALIENFPCEDKQDRGGK
jgi:hypothetical protein